MRDKLEAGGASRKNGYFYAKITHDRYYTYDNLTDYAHSS
jgi:hypothetical protein